MKQYLTIIAVIIGLSACSKPAQIEVLTGHAQGTIWHVSVWHHGDKALSELRHNIETEFVRLDKALSNYRTDSTIESFNRSITLQPVVVGDEIPMLVTEARVVSEASQGCYDLTIKPLFDVWGFKGDTLTPPSSETLSELSKHLGFDKLSVTSNTQLQKNDPRVSIDLSSIAQGYSVGRIAKVVEDMGIQNYLVEIGGELQTRGRKPDGSAWRIGLERPLPGGRTVQKTIVINQDKPIAIMTSGTYRHYFDDAGKRYSHVLDARTGAPVKHNTVSVTVIHDNPTQADAWSTALLCLGVEQGMEIARQHDIAALFINVNSDELVESSTEALFKLKNIQFK
ncbi:MAG: FAD:protein FMN transferase [Alteromonas sp.]|uniref:FAD:protein FMN transferase n=1 Tax=Alteromonas sp. TaxID=232 RepID=UPI0032D900D1